MIMFRPWRRSKKKQRQTVELLPVADRTFVGEEVHMEGLIRCEEDLYIDGSVEGTIELANHRLTVGETGKVHAEIHAQNATISGRVKGTILSRGKVEITRQGHFEGQIEAGGIAVADGAYLKAVIRLTRDSAADAIPGNGPLEGWTAPPEEKHVEDTPGSALIQGNETGRSIE
jgi:cytoskeletal protein CcmA (bactofilin family)